MKFPSKIIYCENVGAYGGKDLMVVSDTGNERILIFHNETLIDYIGSGV